MTAAVTGRRGERNTHSIFCKSPLSHINRLHLHLPLSGPEVPCLHHQVRGKPVPRGLHCRGVTRNWEQTDEGATVLLLVALIFC